MTKRRSRGDGGLHWDDKRKRWIATATIGFTPAGKRITKKGSGTTKTEAKDKLKIVLRDLDDGVGVGQHGYTVAAATAAWLKSGLPNRDPETVANCTYLANSHVVPALGSRRLRDLTADEVDEWLAVKAKVLARSTLIKLLSILRRITRRAQARDLVKRNVAMLCEVPAGQKGRPSKSLTLKEAEALLTAAEHTRMHAYIVVSLLTGARTEEMRALTWDRVDQDGAPYADPPRPPSIEVWRSVQEGGDTKTRGSPGAPCDCPSAALARCASTKRSRRPFGRRLAIGGGISTSCSVPHSEPNWTRPTSGETSAEWSTGRPV